FAIAVWAFALVPQPCRAEFVADHDSGISERANLRDGTVSFLSVFCEQMGANATAEDHSPAPSDHPADDNHRPARLRTLSGINSSGCGSLPSTSVGPSGAGNGIVIEAPPMAGLTCAGRIAAAVCLRVPPPLASRLLDPPRNA